MLSRYLLLLVLSIACQLAVGQTATIKGVVKDANGEMLPFASVAIEGELKGVLTDSTGYFAITGLQSGTYKVLFSYVGYEQWSAEVKLNVGENRTIKVALQPDNGLDEVVVTGTMTPISRTESPVPVEVYSPSFFQKNPSPSIYESLQNVNGVRPQLNCNVCNTGDIHMNGLEGPYTMVLIDGMPIVSGLSTVYGLTGIPNSMIERVEIVKGPASSLYGSEAIGGVINIITKNPASHPLVAVDAQTTSWQEHTADIGIGLKVGKKADVLTGIHTFYYDNPLDLNGDNFTDISLSKRLSVFQKWNIYRKNNRLFTLGARYYTEDRWGGEMEWEPQYRGSDIYYGESIRTDRFELISKYALPTKEKLMLSNSFNYHLQDAWYGTTPFQARQGIGFSQLTWTKQFGFHSVVSGVALRYVHYDDNTTATSGLVEGIEVNEPSDTWLPGVFIQDEMNFTERQKLLLGFRYDQHSVHGSIYTPRMAYKYKLSEHSAIRLNAGTGFRVVNVFTEDHAALTGAREVVITEDLHPERSYNVNLNYVLKVFDKQGNSFGIDLSGWYGRFSNKITADYDTDPDLIIYRNLDGFSESKGVTFNIDVKWLQYVKLLAGMTYTDLQVTEFNGTKSRTFRPVLTEQWSGTWALSLSHSITRLTLDYTGNLYGPMRLPLLGPNDPRASYSPWWSIQNIQVSYPFRNKKWTVFGGVKNILNYRPPSNSIARSRDPFDREVEYGPDGQALITQHNPYGLTFDPSYVFAPNQGIRAYLGVRFNLDR